MECSLQELFMTTFREQTKSQQENHHIGEARKCYANYMA